jgi:hypothetical protein
MSDTLYESYTSGEDYSFPVYGPTWFAQSFTPSTAHTITSVKLKISRTGSPGTFTIDIKATSDGIPTGNSLSTGSTNGNSLSTTDAWVEITVDPAPLSADTKYIIVMNASSGTPTNKVNVRADISSSTYTGGDAVYTPSSGASWYIQGGDDILFYEYGIGATHNVVTSATTLGLSSSATIISAEDYTRSSGATLGTSVSVSLAKVISRTSEPSLSLIASPSKEENLGEYLCVASRESGSVKTASSTGATWTDCAKDAAGGLPGAYFAQYLNRLCALNNQNSGFQYSSANDITANWTEKASFPNLPGNFTDMYVAKDASDDPILYFLTPTGKYYLDVFTNFVFGPTEITWEYDENSGKKGLYFRGFCFDAVGKGIYQSLGDEATFFGPDMDDGLPEDSQGFIADMIGVGFWVVIAVNGGTSNKSGIYKKYINGKHWHVVYKGSVNTPISCLFWDSGTLYFGEGTNVKSLPFSNTTDNYAKLSTHTYSASGDLLDSYFHSEFEAMPKVAHKLRAVTQDCNSNETITIYYRKDDETAWTELGTFSDSPRPTALSFGTNSAGVEFERIQFKRSFARGSTTTNSPKIESLTLEYRVIPPVLWGWTFKADATTHGDVSGKTVLEALKTALETNTLMSFFPDGDKGSTEYFVETSQMPGNEKDTEFGEEGIYQVTVQEVID